MKKFLLASALIAAFGTQVFANFSWNDFKNDAGFKGNKKDAYAWVEWAQAKKNGGAAFDDTFKNTMIDLLAKAGTSKDINAEVKNFKRDKNQYVAEPVKKLIALLGQYSQSVLFKDAINVDASVNAFIKGIADKRAALKRPIFKYSGAAVEKIADDQVVQRTAQSDLILMSILKSPTFDVIKDHNELRNYNKAGFDAAGFSDKEAIMHIKGIMGITHADHLKNINADHLKNIKTNKKKIKEVATLWEEIPESERPHVKIEGLNNVDGKVTDINRLDAIITGLMDEIIAIEEADKAAEGNLEKEAEKAKKLAALKPELKVLFEQLDAGDKKNFQEHFDEGGHVKNLKLSEAKALKKAISEALDIKKEVEEASGDELDLDELEKEATVEAKKEKIKKDYLEKAVELVDLSDSKILDDDQNLKVKGFGDILEPTEEDLKNLDKFIAQLKSLQDNSPAEVTKNKYTQKLNELVELSESKDLTKEQGQRVEALGGNLKPSEADLTTLNAFIEELKLLPEKKAEEKKPEEKPEEKVDLKAAAKTAIDQLKEKTIERLPGDAQNANRAELELFINANVEKAEIDKYHAKKRIQVKGGKGKGKGTFKEIDVPSFSEKQAANLYKIAKEKKDLHMIKLIGDFLESKTAKEAKKAIDSAYPDAE